MSMLPTTSFVGIGSNEQVFLFNFMTSLCTSCSHKEETYLEIMYMKSTSVGYLYLVFYPGLTESSAQNMYLNHLQRFLYLYVVVYQVWTSSYSIRI